MKGLNNPYYPIVPFVHMNYCEVSYKDGKLKLKIDYENGKRYNFRKHIGGC